MRASQSSKYLPEKSSDSAVHQTKYSLRRLIVIDHTLPTFFLLLQLGFLLLLDVSPLLLKPISV